MRSFIALPLPLKLKKKIYEKVRDLKIPGVKLVEEENYHITLLFLGDIPEEEIETIKQALKSIDMEKKELTIKSYGFFPKQKPRVVWLGVEPHEYLEALHREVVKAVGVMPDKPFQPHITIARIRDYSLNSAELIVKRIHDLKGESFIADRIILYESKLTSRGPIYREISIHELK